MNETETQTLTQTPPTQTRLLAAEEWPRIFELFAESFPGKPIPQPPYAACTVVENMETGEIVAAMFFLMAYHMEPFCARKGYGGFYSEMVRFTEAQLEGMGELTYYVSTPDSPQAREREERLGRTVLSGFVTTHKEIR